MTTFAQTPERSAAPSRGDRFDSYQHMSAADLASCLDATGTAIRVAHDRRDAALVAELRARYDGLTRALAGRRSN